MQLWGQYTLVRVIRKILQTYKSSSRFLCRRSPWNNHIIQTQLHTKSDPLLPLGWLYLQRWIIRSTWHRLRCSCLRRRECRRERISWEAHAQLLWLHWTSHWPWAQTLVFCWRCHRPRHWFPACLFSFDSSSAWLSPGTCGRLTLDLIRWLRSHYAVCSCRAHLNSMKVYQSVWWCRFGWTLADRRASSWPATPWVA